MSRTNWFNHNINILGNLTLVIFNWLINHYIINYAQKLSIDFHPFIPLECKFSLCQWCILYLFNYLLMNINIMIKLHHLIPHFFMFCKQSLSWKICLWLQKSGTVETNFKNTLKSTINILYINCLLRVSKESIYKSLKDIVKNDEEFHKKSPAHVKISGWLKEVAS